MLRGIVNHQGNVYTIRYGKSVSAFMKNNQLNSNAIDAWKNALVCDQVIIDQDRVWFLQRIEDAEIAE